MNQLSTTMMATLGTPTLDFEFRRKKKKVYLFMKYSDSFK